MTARVVGVLMLMLAVVGQAEACLPNYPPLETPIVTTSYLIQKTQQLAETVICLDRRVDDLRRDRLSTEVDLRNLRERLDALERAR